MITGSTITKYEKPGRTVYTLCYEEYNGMAKFVISHAVGTAVLSTPEGVSWFTHSFLEDSDLSERQAVEAVLWPLQDAGIAAFTPIAVNRPVPSGGYLISTSWVKVFFGDPIANVQYAAMPGGSLYELEKPKEGIVETLLAGDSLTFLRVKDW